MAKFALFVLAATAPTAQANHSDCDCECCVWPQYIPCAHFLQCDDCDCDYHMAEKATSAGWCTSFSPSNACGPCDVESECGNDQAGVYFCQVDKDPACGPASSELVASGGAAGWCTSFSPLNACGPCDVEAECGNADAGLYFCQKDKDPACGSRTSSLTVASAGASAGWCISISPSNACGPCDVESECGNDQTGLYYCQASKDPACGPASKELVASGGAAGWCTSFSPLNACGPCDVEAECGNADAGLYFCQVDKDPACGPASTELVASGGAAGWCTSFSPLNACGPCDVEAECGNADAGLYFCQQDKDPACGSRTSSLTVASAGASAGWCISISPSNACGPCDVESQCGNDQTGLYYCQASKDPACGSQEKFLSSKMTLV